MPTCQPGQLCKTGMNWTCALIENKIKEKFKKKKDNLDSTLKLQCQQDTMLQIVFNSICGMYILCICTGRKKSKWWNLYLHNKIEISLFVIVCNCLVILIANIIFLLRLLLRKILILIAIPFFTEWACISLLSSSTF